MEFRPILSTLRRHKTAASLMVLEIAVTCAILCNAIFLIADRLERLNYPSGVAETELVRIQLGSIGNPPDAKARIQRDTALLQRIPGVRSVALVNQVPFGNSTWSTGISLTPDQPRQTLNAALWGTSENFLETTGVRLIAGRFFLPDELQDFATVFEGDAPPMLPVVVVTRRAAEKLFPGEEALGKQVYVYKNPSRIVGIVEELARPNNLVRQPYSVLAPVRMNSGAGSGAGYWLLRTDAAQREAVRQAGVQALLEAGRDRVVVKQDTLSEVRETYFRQDRAMASLLVAVCVALLVVTALGIVGLASFWVQQRSRMIGIRRALGATRGQILRYFQAENLLLTSLGIGLGMALAYAINLALMAHYELPRLPLVYLPIGALALWALGQLAVLGPALRAAALPPVVVMRLH
jgi:putative ABC transport system permease protein